MLSSHLDRDNEAIRGAIDLRPNEGVVITSGRAAGKPVKPG